MQDQMTVQLFLETNTNLIFFDDGRYMFHIVQGSDLNGVEFLLIYENEICPIKVQFGNVSDEANGDKGVEIMIIENKHLIPVQTVLDVATSIVHIIANGVKGLEDGANHNSSTPAAKS